MKRLFLFAAYDSLNVVGEMLVSYVRVLSECGDVVFWADSDFPREELDKLEKFTLYAGAERHSEYDFGSYKRSWKWARENLDIRAYDVLYMVNDSVYGPYSDVRKPLGLLESSGADAFSMVLNNSRHGVHLQSWFIGLTKSVFNAQWFDEFIGSVTRLDDKVSVCRSYETGFTSLLLSKGLRLSSVCVAPGKSVYNKPLSLFEKGVPFVKKSSFVRHNGCLGAQLKRLLDKVGQEWKTKTMEDVAIHNGTTYASTLLTTNPFIIAGRYLEYLAGKVF